MLFNSYEFLLGFLPVVVIVFFLLGRSRYPQAALLWLIAASLCFYGWWNPNYLVLLGGSVITNYFLGHRLRVRRAKGLLAVGVTLNVLVIAYFKYANFFIENLNALADTNLQVGAIILPLAISFFTLQQIAFLVDAYRGEIAVHGFFHYCLFVVLFPQLIAGPIVRFKEMFPQLTNTGIFRFHIANLATGLTIFAIGLFKKVVLADTLAVYATPVFSYVEGGGSLTLVEAWAGVLTYSLQIYFDFSGYTDMAIGIGKTFGLTLPENFNSPYKARNIIEFWRCWHMTLSRFFRDYLYIPLGGNRKGPTREYLNLIGTMLVVGLWHGAAWTFVAWGALHGLYVLVNHGWRQMKRSLNWSRQRSAFRTCVSTAVTFLAVTVAWVFFRSETFSGALALLQAMVGANGVALPRPYLGYLNAFAGVGDVLLAVGVRFEDLDVYYGGEQLLWIVPAFLVVWCLPNTWELTSDQVNWIDIRATPISIRYTPSMRWGIYVGGLLLLSIASITKMSEFIYFNF